ncbi:MAG TPA: hypothetical protein PKI80_11795, partial [Deltaproteobacteria bacterium]|nr:hypothetical protein [Deltaproteobacteria bacterium]
LSRILKDSFLQDAGMINPTKKSSLFDLHRILFHRARGLSSYNKECVSVPLETAHVKKINPRERTARSWNVEAEYKYLSMRMKWWR